MRKYSFGLVLFGWYFLVLARGGSNFSSNQIFSNVGPFKTKEKCVEIAFWVNTVGTGVSGSSRITDTSECWEDTDNTNKTSKER